MKENIRDLAIDLGLLSGGIFFALLGAQLTNGMWIFLLVGVVLVALPVARAKRLGSFWIPKDLNQRRLRLKIDRDSCMGVASCVKLAPRVFKLDETELKSSFISSAPLVVLDERGASNQTILQAAISCPYKAIILEDEITGEQVYPQ